MSRLDTSRWWGRLVAVAVVVSVAVLPLMHAGPASADTGCGDVAAAACCADPCGSCMTAEGEACCPVGAADDGEELPTDPTQEDDRPCDCPCCGKVLPVVSMMSPVPAAAPFWGETPELLPIPLCACPESAAVRVDVRPPMS